MSTARTKGVERRRKPPAAAVKWSISADAASGTLRHREAQLRTDEERANSIGIAIVTSLLFVLFAAALLFGGHAAIAPLLHRAEAGAASSAASQDNGTMVYAMPDQEFCRQMLFDNATGTISEGTLVRCPGAPGGRGGPSLMRFRWGTGH